MVAYLPIPGGHIKLAERFVDPGMFLSAVVILSYALTYGMKQLSVSLWVGITGTRLGITWNVGLWRSHERRLAPS